MLSRRTEDYLRTILNITEEKGYARVKDIAEALGVKPSSVVEMLKKLNDAGYVVHRRYDGVTLTPKGLELGKIAKSRHEIIQTFLEIIKVPKTIATKDACKMEHELHPKTIEQIGNLVRFVKTSPGNPEWLQHFQRFCDMGNTTTDQEKTKKM
ncbi:MAG: metal-dependent transcriptional regulator [Methanobacteriota archaeon]|nr:MAG: metal-dependent transcriptional regulator [Euryarchaeota archaeon]